MTYNPAKHHRRSIRLKGYDYTQPGAYFVTIVTQGRECVFGDVVDGEMRSNRLGQIAQREWERLPRRFPRIQLGAFIVMPNHVHGIIIITDDDVRRGTASQANTVAVNGPAVPLPAGRADTVAVNGPAVPLPAGRADTVAVNGPAVPLHSREQFGKPIPGSIPTIVRSYKSAATLRINYVRNASGAPVWQRNYHEHVIRDEDEFDRIRNYIDHNPYLWDTDDENPSAK